MKIGLLVKPGLEPELLERLRRVVAGWRHAGHAVRPRVAFEPGDGRRFSRAATERGADVVVAVGGDGTVNEVANGILSGAGTARLGIVPQGTANDFARGLGLPETLEEAAEVVVAGQGRRVDCGRVNGRVFINVSTGGVGAAAAEETPPEAKKLLGPWAYLITGVSKFGELTPTHLRFELEETALYDGRALMFAVGNGRQTGGGNVVAPRASLDDGLLDLIIVPEMTRMEFVSLLPVMRRGEHPDREDVVYEQVPGFTVSVAGEAELMVHADGERVPGSVFEYEVEEGALEVLTPG